jgi:hypothetical protein
VRPKVASLKRAKLLRRDEQALLPGGGSYDGRPAQVADRVAGNNHDRAAHRLESRAAEARRLTLRRPIQPLIPDLIERRVRLRPQFLDPLNFSAIRMASIACIALLRSTVA